MNCPRCKTGLTKQDIQVAKNKTVEIDQCPTCEGSWYDFNKLEQVETTIEPVLVERRQLPSEYEQLEALFCPKCKSTDKPMEKHEHVRDKHVIFDFCTGCGGVWLDGGELRAIHQENFGKAVIELFRRAL